MPRKKTPLEPIEVPRPGEEPEIYPSEDPEVQIPPDEEPDIIPDEDPFETPPYEIPPPGEGP